MRRRCDFKRDARFVPALVFPPVVRLSIVLVCLGLATASSRAEDQSSGTISREVKEVFSRCSKAVVKIRAVDEHGKLAGTGFFIDPAGTLYTAFSVGADAHDFTVEIDG